MMPGAQGESSTRETHSGTRRPPELEAQRWEAVGRLVGGVAHEFNNLLTAIMIYSDLVAEEAGPQSRLRLLAREIRVAGGRGASLTRHLLALSRPHSEAAAPVSLSRVVHSMAPLLEHLAGEQVELAIECSEGEHRVVLDLGEAQQILLNLVANARDAMPQGGRLRIQVSTVEFRAGDALPEGLADRRKENQQSGTRTLPPGPYVVLRVRDTGRGMSAETRARLFEPFFTTKPGRGSGLGLAAVYEIVRRRGGHLGVESAPGAGTTMSIFWPPAGREVPEESVAEGSESWPHGAGETVLLVEENEHVRRSLRRVLLRLGYRVLTAQDGASALRHARRRALVDVLLVRLRKSDLSAERLAAALREKHGSMKVLYMCNAAQTDRKMGRGGPDPRFVLRKPFPSSELARKLREALQEEPAA